MKCLTHVFRSLLLLASLTALTGVASAQSSLVFKDASGRTVEFTNFGTIVYPDQNLVTRGYEVVYHDGSSLKQAWYLNSSFNAGIVSVSLSADKPSGFIVSDGAGVFVRAIVRTADNKLTITHRYFLRASAPEIEAVVTVENSSSSPISLLEISILTPSDPECQCPCDPASVFDQANIGSSIITIGSTKYRKTTATYPSPTMISGGSRDLPGCDDPKPPHRIPIR